MIAKKNDSDGVDPAARGLALIRVVRLSVGASKKCWKLRCAIAKKEIDSDGGDPAAHGPAGASVRVSW